MPRRGHLGLIAALIACAPLLAAAHAVSPACVTAADAVSSAHAAAAPVSDPAGTPLDYWSMVTVFVLASFIGLGVIRRVSRLLHTPLMSLTNAISAIAVVGSILVAGGDFPPLIRGLGAIALFASTTNIVSGFLITDRMLKMFKDPRDGEKR